MKLMMIRTTKADGTEVEIAAADMEPIVRANARGSAVFKLDARLRQGFPLETAEYIYQLQPVPDDVKAAE